MIWEVEKTCDRRECPCLIREQSIMICEVEQTCGRMVIRMGNGLVRHATGG